MPNQNPLSRALVACAVLVLVVLLGAGVPAILSADAATAAAERAREQASDAHWAVQAERGAVRAGMWDAAAALARNETNVTVFTQQWRAGEQALVPIDARLQNTSERSNAAYAAWRAQSKAGGSTFLAWIMCIIWCPLVLFYCAICARPAAKNKQGNHANLTAARPPVPEQAYQLGEPALPPVEPSIQTRIDEHKQFLADIRRNNDAWLRHHELAEQRDDAYEECLSKIVEACLEMRNPDTEALVVSVRDSIRACDDRVRSIQVEECNVWIAQARTPEQKATCEKLKATLLARQERARQAETTVHAEADVEEGS